MGNPHAQQGAFSIPDVIGIVPERLKPWLFIFFVIIVQFSGGVYLAAASQMVGSTAMMEQDVMMAGVAQLVGMSVNFAVMFRLKFRYSCRTGMLICCAAMIAANIVCATTTSVPLLVASCLVAGWFRMWATFLCNSTIQLWLTPVRDMAVFFCYVYLVVDGAIRLGGVATVYTTFVSQWECMPVIMTGLLVLVMIMVAVLLRPVHGPMYIPLLGIDWIGSLLWSIFMLCFAYVCIYGNYYDWWEAAEICGATVIGLVCLTLNLWRASFLRHPYISFAAMTRRNVVYAMIIYTVFYILMAPGHVFESGFASGILGFDETNLIDLNWYVFAGIVCGVGFTYLTFARRRWRYKTLTAIAFALAAVYLAYFYFLIDYDIEKEMLFIPLFCRGASEVIISIVFLTSIVHCGLHFFVFPQALVINGFFGAVMGATFGPAVIGEFLRRTVAANSALLGSAITGSNTHIPHIPLGELYGMVQRQALVESMKEIYGWLLIAGIICFAVIMCSYSSVRPWAIFPKWKTIRRSIRSLVRREAAAA